MRIALAAAAIFVCLTLLSVVQSQDTLPPGGAAPQADAAPADPAFHQQVSYALGRTFAQNLRANEINPELQSLMAGINDVFSGAKPKFSDEQCEASLQQFGQVMQKKAEARKQVAGAKNAQVAEQFLAENGKREGVQTTASGLQYRVIRQGDGPSPTLNDIARCNYRGSLLDGTEFDASARHGGPAEFPVSGVIPGWTEALQKMKVGDKWQLFVPPNLAYGTEPPQGSPIEANSLLVFEIELLGIKPQ